MRILPAIAFAAILGLALPAMAAPSSISDCEKIQAADAYNQCLALFGPVPRGHSASARDFGGDGDSGGAADVVETANPEASVPAKERRTSHGRHYRSHATRHYHHYGHYHGRSHSSASETHHKGKTLAFNVISGRAKTR
ncbi:hypothetical protein [Methylocella tundrae]|uniref:hypothetical protein n=1 Tax=Methylocella tundrae TaxID=227605 RepID=UPI0030FEE979|nr:hypothetical protein SIN04_14345 [Methylocella tundrae]